MANYDDVIEKWTPEQWQKFGSMGGTIDDNNNLIAGITPESVVAAGNNPLTLNNNQKGLFGLTNGYWNNIEKASGLAGTVYELYDSTLGNKAQMFDTQMKAMKQNMANVKEDRAAHKTFQNNIGSGFNQAMGSGLAANAVK